MSPHRTIVSNFLALFTGELFARVLGVFATVFLARTLGVEGFGKINFAMVVVVYFSMITTWGYDTYAIREVSKQHSILPGYLSNIQLMRFTIGAVIYALFFLFVSQLEIPQSTRMLLYIFGLSVFTQPLNIAWTFAAMENMKATATSTVVNQAVFLFIVLLFVRGIDEINTVAWAYVAGEFVALIATVVIFLRYVGRVPFEFSWQKCKEIFKNSMPFGVSRVLRIFTLSTSIVVIGFLASETDVGIYSAAHRVVFLLVTLSMYYHLSLYPTLSKAYQDHDTGRLSGILTTAVRLATVLALPMGIGGLLLSKPIILFIFGADYQASHAIFSILVWMAALLLLSGIFSYALLVLGAQKTVARIIVIAFLANIALNILLVSRYGIRGAAITAVLTELGILVISAYKVRSLGVNVSLVSSIPKALVASIVMTLVLYALADMHLIFLLIIGCVSYFLTMLLIKGITSAEINNMIAIFQKHPD
ncbi:MAG: flippase [Gammaproteobacteria bacterium]|nr:flippase [Gammaproteobacteria bacterium]